MRVRQSSQLHHITHFSRVAPTLFSRCRRIGLFLQPRLHGLLVTQIAQLSQINVRTPRNLGGGAMGGMGLLAIWLATLSYLPQ